MILYGKTRIGREAMKKKKVFTRRNGVGQRGRTHPSRDVARKRYSGVEHPAHVRNLGDTPRGAPNVAYLVSDQMLQGCRQATM